MGVELTRRTLQCLALLLTACMVSTVSAQPHDATWTAEVQEGGNRYLSWSATVPLLGKPTKINLAFQCNPKSEKDVHGTLGFDLYLHGIAALKPFSFDDFDGPDAKAGADQPTKSDT